MQTQINGLQIHVYGHESADPSAVAREFNGVCLLQAQPDSDLAIFAIDPSEGIDGKTIDLWHRVGEFQVPRLVVVTHLEKEKADFEDAVLIANRVFDQLATPFLILHDDLGAPVALISLTDLNIIDYSANPPTITASQPEHQELVEEFRDEYLQQIEAAGIDAFRVGLFFPAIPLILKNGMGVDIVNSYIAQLI